MQQALFTPVGLTVLDVTTKGKFSVKQVLKQPLHQPLLIGTVLGIIVSVVSSKVGHFIVPNFLFDPIDMIGDSAVPMILMHSACRCTARSRCRTSRICRRSGRWRRSRTS